MSRRRKKTKGRHTGGGRTTPKGTQPKGMHGAIDPPPHLSIVPDLGQLPHPDPLADSDAPDEPITEVLDGLRSALSSGSTVDIDVWSSELIGSARSATSDDVPWDTDDELLAAAGGEIPNFEELVFGMVAAFAEQLIGPHDEIAASAMWATLPYLPPEPAELAEAVLDVAPTPVPSWVDDVGRGVVEEALRHDVETQDSAQIGLIVRYPGSRQRFMVLTLIDFNLGGLPTEVMVTDHIDAVRGLARQEGISESPIDLATARAEIENAYRIEDMTLGPSMDASVDLIRPMLERLLPGMPEPAKLSDPVEVPVDERDALVAQVVEETLATGGNLTGDADGLIFAARTMVDYCCDWHGRHPAAWSPVRLEMFLMDFVLRKVAVGPAELESLPEQLAALAPAAQRAAGWEDRHLAESREVLAAVADDFRAALHSGEHRSPSTQLLMTAIQDGIDIGDPEALSALIDEVNAAGGLDAFLGNDHGIAGDQNSPWMDGEDPLASAVATIDVSGLDASLSQRVLAIDDALFAICVDLFDPEHLALSRSLLLRIAAEHPAELRRGKVDGWAGGIVYALAQINGMWDRWSDLDVWAADVVAVSGVSQQTLAQRAKKIRAWFDLDADPPPEAYQRSDVRRNRERFFGRLEAFHREHGSD